MWYNLILEECGDKYYYGDTERETDVMSGRKDWPIDDVEGLISKIREAKKELESRQFSSDDYGKSFKEDSEEIITAARSMLRQLGVEDELDA